MNKFPSIPIARPALELASFDDLAAELGRRYPQFALIVNEPVMIDGTKYLERQAFNGEFNLVLGLLDTLHDTVMDRKKQLQQVTPNFLDPLGH